MLELARPEDRQAVNHIMTQAHRLHVSWRPDIYQMTEEIFPEAVFLEDIQKRQMYVAKLHGQIVGLAKIRIQQAEGEGLISRKIFLLDTLAVEESCRNQGIGTLIMEDVWALAKAYGCTDLQLSVNPQNEAALHLYQKCGFTIRNLNMQRKV